MAIAVRRHDLIYLRYMFERSGLPAPATVAVHTPGTDWVDEQVRAELAELFPAGLVAINPAGPGPVDLRVLVSPSDAGIAPLVAWSRDHRHATSVGLGFYCLDPRRLELVHVGRLDRWVRVRRLERAASLARVRFPRLWARVALVYGRCASCS